MSSDNLNLLEAIADYDQTPEEAIAELTSEGVDVSSFLKRVQQTIERHKAAEPIREGVSLCPCVCHRDPRATNWWWVYCIRCGHHCLA